MNQKRLPQLVCLNTCIPNFIHFYQKTIFSFLCLWVGISSSIFAQIADNKGFQQRVLPSSPNAAALGKFGDVPVSAYTGVPNISVPIAELKGKYLSMPISLSYHAGGVKVDEVASRMKLLVLGGTFS